MYINTQGLNEDILKRIKCDCHSSPLKEPIEGVKLLREKKGGTKQTKICEHRILGKLNYISTVKTTNFYVY